MQIGIFGLLGALVSSSTTIAAEKVPFDLANVDLVDVLSCKIDGGHYVGFTMTISEEDSEAAPRRADGSISKRWPRSFRSSPTWMRTARSSARE